MVVQLAGSGANLLPLSPTLPNTLIRTPLILLPLFRLSVTVRTLPRAIMRSTIHQTPLWLLHHHALQRTFVSVDISTWICPRFPAL